MVVVFFLFLSLSIYKCKYSLIFACRNTIFLLVSVVGVLTGVHVCTTCLNVFNTLLFKFVAILPFQL